MHWRNKQALIIGIVLLTVAGVSQTPLMQHARSSAWRLWVATVGRVLHIKTNFTADEQARIEQLLSENLRLKAELGDYQRVRRQLGTPAFADFRAIPAAVIGRPIDTFRSELIISKGARDGVALNAPVLINGSTLIGFISALNETTAVCRLLFHPSTTLAVNILDTKDLNKAADPAEILTQGLVQGQRYTAIDVTTVPRDQKLHEGLVVATTAKPNEIPYGLVIGTIQAIYTQAGETYQGAHLTVPYDPDSVQAVTILFSP